MYWRRFLMIIQCERETQHKLVLIILYLYYINIYRFSEKSISHMNGDLTKHIVNQHNGLMSYVMVSNVLYQVSLAYMYQYCMKELS